MSSPAFKRALEATGYLTPSGGSAPGFIAAEDAASAKLKRLFADERVGLKADGVFTAQNSPTSIFKDAGASDPSPEDMKRWHEAAWNIGIALLLWIVIPTSVRLYDCYASPAGQLGLSEPPPLDQFVLQSDDRLRVLDTMCSVVSC